MILAKRGNRAGATSLEGGRTNVIHLKHSDDGILWEQTLEPVVKEKAKKEPKAKAAPKPQPKAKAKGANVQVGRAPTGVQPKSQIQITAKCYGFHRSRSMGYSCTSWCGMW